MRPVDNRSGTMRADVGVDVEGEVEHRGSSGEPEKVSLGSEGEYFLAKRVGVEVLHQPHRAAVGAFEDVADIVHPLVGVVGLDSLVAPVGRQALFRHKIHAPRPELHLHPFVAGSHHGGVERLVAVTLGERYPVLHARGVGGVHVGKDGVGGPAIHLLALARRVYDHADGEEVVDAGEVHLLFLHFVPDGRDGFGPSFDLEIQTGLFEARLHRVDERLDVGVARSFGLVELVRYLGIYLAVGVFQGQVFKFPFDLVESETVCEARI